LGHDVGLKAAAYPTFAECLREKSGLMAGVEKSSWQLMPKALPFQQALL